MVANAGSEVKVLARISGMEWLFDDLGLIYKLTSPAP
jgi:hypothetical protein